MHNDFPQPLPPLDGEFSQPEREVSPAEGGVSDPSANECPPSSALDLEELVKALFPQPGQLEGGASPPRPEGFNLEPLFSRYRIRLNTQEQAMASAKEEAIRAQLHAHDLRFSEGNFGNCHFFFVPSMGFLRRRFQLSIDVEEKRCLVHFTATLPFLCNREMLPAVGRYLVEINQRRLYYTWRYDPELRSISARQTVPYWDPALDKKVLRRLLEGLLYLMHRRFDVLEWLSTGMFSNEPDEDTLETCRRLLSELEQRDDKARQRLLTRLRLALEEWS